MSSYVCFFVKETHSKSKNAILVNSYGRSSLIYDVFIKIFGYSEEMKEFTDKHFCESLSIIDNKINENKKTISLYDDCMKNSKDEEAIFDYAKAKQESLETIEQLHETKNWLKFYFELDCKKYICFE